MEGPISDVAFKFQHPTKIIVSCEVTYLWYGAWLMQVMMQKMLLFKVKLTFGNSLKTNNRAVMNQDKPRYLFIID
jgi:hypothetical protein